MTKLTLEARMGGAWRMKAGQTVRVINPYGTQAVDAWALADDGAETGHGTCDYSSMEHTRSVNSSIYVDTGLAVMGMDRRPLITTPSSAPAIVRSMLTSTSRQSTGAAPAISTTLCHRSACRCLSPRRR